MPEYIAVFTVGGLVYGLLEIIWRGWTHWTMLICGGLCFTLMYLIARTPMRAAQKLFACAAVITTVEFVTGCIVNLTLGMGVWDYSALPFDLMHAFATMLFLGVLYVPWTRRIDRIVRKYDLRERG